MNKRITRREFMAAASAALAAKAIPGEPSMQMIGMYIHQHWPYNHPYCARTWTLSDWNGYLTGIRELGYNTVMIWPVLDTMPEPLTPSDQRAIAKIARVIRLAHEKLGMKVYLALCPNVMADDARASRAPFEKRHFFACDIRVNPGDAEAMARMMRRREEMLRPLAEADGVAIIDSDPGGYPNSTNAEFVRLLGEHRKMLDRLRPGMELVYWMHMGWEAYSRFYATGRLEAGAAEEHLDALRRLQALNPEPWALFNGLPYAQSLGLASRVALFNYGVIEWEPQFPKTNFGGRGAYDGGRALGPRGVMGNAQTHCVQIPNTFAFARGALGLPLEEADYKDLAEKLIPGLGELIHAGWRSLASHDARAMRDAARQIARAASGRHAEGPLSGLLFGSPRRFLDDLVLMLRYQAALEDFVASGNDGTSPEGPLLTLVTAAGAWQKVHGYQNLWQDEALMAALRRLKDPAVDEVLGLSYEARPPLPPNTTPFQQVARNFLAIETYTPRLLHAMRRAAGHYPSRRK
ncbi:MAG: hypothetical protein ACP5VE_11975 [Chthonomonadales bacterium]